MTIRPEAAINAAAVQEAEPLADKPRTTWRDAWDRIRRRRIALASLAVIILYLLVALLAFTPILKERIERTVGQPNDPPRFFAADTRVDVNAPPDANAPPGADAPPGANARTPSPSLWFGTDFLGRSVFWRFLYGSRVALTVAFLASGVSIVIGVALGLLAGYRGGWVDALIIWLFSTVSSIPGILLIMALAFALRGRNMPLIRDAAGEPISLTGIPTIVMALGLTSWVGLCRLIRGEVLRLRDRDYVMAARAAGLRDHRILSRHILPNVFHLIIIDFSLGLGAFVQAEVILSFLGLGVTDQPSWGRMIDDAKLELLKGVWWQMAAATMAIFVFSLAVNLLGDALRDALDPRLRGVD